MTTQAIQNVITDEINPTLKIHAGSAEFVSFDDGVLTLRIFGGCSGCPSSTLTMFNGIVPILKEKFPEIEDVVLD
jgi:Fe-S cluster biogenesis protein NfuA